MSRLSKYILNPALEIIKREEYSSLNISIDNKNPLYQQLIRQEQFLLSNKTRDKILIINPAIKLFLESFQTAAHFQSALIHFSQAAQIAQEEALPVAESFFENMKERGVIVSLNAANKWLKKIMIKLENKFNKLEKRLSIGTCTFLFIMELYRLNKFSLLY